MERTVCVYSSSSEAIAPVFFAAATDLGRALAQAGFTLVYGGAQVGLMGAMARAVHAHGGRVVGVIPSGLRTIEVAYEQADELIVTPDMRTRKAVMEARATAFVALPGGFGTLEEILEILTLKQLGWHNKPLVLLNTAGFYDPLIELFEHIYRGRFAPVATRQLYYVTAAVDDAMARVTAAMPAATGMGE